MYAKSAVNLMHMGSAAPTALADLFAIRPQTVEQTGTTRDGRAYIIWDWFSKYDIAVGWGYSDTSVIVVNIAGTTFVDKSNEFPSETLFTNMALAINTGKVPKRDVQ